MGEISRMASRLRLTNSWHVFWAMVTKELIILTRYPVGFVASFGQIFLMVAIFVLAGLTFSDRGATGAFGTTSGVVIYGFVIYMFMSDTLWTIGYNVRREQVQGTLEQLYLSPASKFASLVARVAHLVLWTGLMSLAGVLLMVAMLGALPFENPVFGFYLLGMTLAGTFGLGFAFAALTLYLREAAQTMANLLQFGLLILCANFFPFSALPPVALAVSSRWGVSRNGCPAAPRQSNRWSSQRINTTLRRSRCSPGPDAGIGRP